jgi:FixJ family two-component response regulator
MRLKEVELVGSATILIAVGDGVLADSLRFSLDLEGYDVSLCEEHSLLAAMTGLEQPGCLVVDQDVFFRLVSGGREQRFAGFDVPIILMASHKTPKLAALANQAGIHDVIEKPLLGSVLLDTIRMALKETLPSGRAERRA